MQQDAKGKFLPNPDNAGLSRKEYMKRWRERNASRIAECAKANYTANAEARRAYSRDYWNQADATQRAAKLARNKAWQLANPEKHKANRRRHYLKHKHRLIPEMLAYRKSRPEQTRATARRYTRKLLLTTKGRVDHRMSVGILQSLKANKANKSKRSWESLVGYSVGDLMRHLQANFKPGMTWKKLMDSEIEIDHKIPKSKFQYSTSDDPQFRQCWALENLQPMWSIANRSKGNKLTQPTQIALGV